MGKIGGRRETDIFAKGRGTDIRRPRASHTSGLVSRRRRRKSGGRTIKETTARRNYRMNKRAEGNRARRRRRRSMSYLPHRPVYTGT